IDRMDFNATTHGQRDIDDDRLSNLIERVSEKRLGLKDVEADIIGRSYEYLIRKFAEGSGQSAGEFFTPPEVARIMALIMDPDPGLSVYDSVRRGTRISALLPPAAIRSPSPNERGRGKHEEGTYVRPT